MIYLVLKNMKPPEIVVRRRFPHHVTDMQPRVIEFKEAREGLCPYPCEFAYVVCERPTPQRLTAYFSERARWRFPIRLLADDRIKVVTLFNSGDMGE